MSLQSARREVLAPTLTLYGRVESPRVAALSAAVTADVETVTALEGETVESGQLLVMLDDRESALVLEQRRAEVAELLRWIARELDQHLVEHLTKVSADELADPMFRRQFPHLAELLRPNHVAL